MNLYKYSAIIARTWSMEGNVTFVDNRVHSGFLHVNLDSECKTGHILGESPVDAASNALKRLQQLYPEERGYRLPEYVRVEEVEEIEVTV